MVDGDASSRDWNQSLSVSVHFDREVAVITHGEIVGERTREISNAINLKTVRMKEIQFML